MKAIFFSVLTFVTFPAVAQTALNPMAPAMQGFGPVAAPSSPALTVAPANPTTLGEVASTATTSIAQLSALLTNLQNDLEVTLPLASAFNNNFDFVDIASNDTPNQALPPGNNMPVNNSTSRLATNVSILNASANGSTTNTFGVPPGFAVFPITRDTVRGLMILQNDIERMLPLLNAVNSGNNTSPNATPLVLSPGTGP